MPPLSKFFSHSYEQARQRFLFAADEAGANVTSYPIEATSDQQLAIDVATLGPQSAPTVVVSSGVHGVEGFFGAAVQLAQLSKLVDARLDSVRYVLIHAVNPHGFAYLRRFNENNVDLNRNFLDASTDYAGASAGYQALHALLNPPSSPARFEPFRLKALWQILRRGMQPLKEAVAGGQYEYPLGIFFGGTSMSASARIVRDHCQLWLGSSHKIMHLDLHTGLGPYGDYRLLLTEADKRHQRRWYVDSFGEGHVESPSRHKRIAYTVSGLFGDWMQRRFHDRSYRFAVAEFGTYDVLRVLAAIRAENRAHHYDTVDSASYIRAKAELVECFCPASSIWKTKVVERAVHIIQQATQALLKSGVH